MLRVRATISGGFAGPYLMTLYFANDDTQAGAVAANTAVGNFLTALAPRMVASSSNWATEPIVAQLDFTGTLLATYGVAPVTGTGGSAGTTLPLQCQGLIRWKTTAFLSGRPLIGHTYVPNVNVNDNLGNGPSAAYNTVLQNAANALIAAAGPDLVIWSRAHRNAAQVAAASTGTKFAILRSRRD